MPSFDVVSKVAWHEIDNALNQAQKELSQRFDFKDAGAAYEHKDYTVTMRAKVEFQLKQMYEILKQRLAKRGIDLVCLELKDAQTNIAEARQEVVLRHGIDQEAGKKIVKAIKESKLKVQGAIQGEKVRVTGKQRDDLQQAIALLRRLELDRPLQFENFRD